MLRSRWKALVGSQKQASTELIKDRLYLISSFGLRGFTDAGFWTPSQSLMLSGSFRSMQRSQQESKPNQHPEKDISCDQQTKMQSGCVHTPFFVIFLKPVSSISVCLVSSEFEYAAGQSQRQHYRSWHCHT